MAEEHEDDHEQFESSFATERQTAPQGPYSLRDVGVGFVVALVGVLVTFGVPLLLT